MRGGNGRPDDRCPAPSRTDGGTLRCVIAASHCDEPGHARYDRVAPLMELVWRAKPWWPNELGRAQDRGEAHTPNVWPCRHCDPVLWSAVRRDRPAPPTTPAVAWWRRWLPW